ncbi:hypothetical protein C8F01DRAFT_1372566 [Mycena amicta]|nr:hypothetical protein C8F01DRAFT_1372566 [Mycena amicta]
MLRRFASRLHAHRPVLTPSRRFAATLPSPAPTPSVDDDQKSNELVASFMEFMHLVKDERQSAARQADWIINRFQDTDLQIPSQPKIAENIIHFLVERRLFYPALAVYQRILDDGFLPLPSTDALFLAVTMKASKAPGDVQLDDFKRIMSYPSFTEPHFLDFLEHIEKLEISADSGAQLTRLFIELKGPGYTPSRDLVMKLIDLESKAGNFESAAQTIVQSDSFDIPAQPYARMLHSAAPDDNEAVDWIMSVMREKDVPVHILVFNSLIARQQHVHGLRKGFAFYNIIMRLATTTPLKPDVFTYKHLFRLLGYQYKTDYDSNLSRKKQRPSVITSPRQLFYDMMTLWFATRFHVAASEDPSIRRTQMKNDEALLTIAFRTFLHLNDYPAALVTLQVFSDLGIPITERTYFILLRYMTRKVYYDVLVARKKRKTKPRLALFLLGNFDSYKIVHREPDVTYKWIMERLLDMHRGGKEHHDTYKRGRVPTITEVLEHDVERSGNSLDPWPLSNILRHCIRMQPSTTGEPWGDEWRKRKVRAVKFEMIPRNVEFHKW